MHIAWIYFLFFKEGFAFAQWTKEAKQNAGASLKAVQPTPRYCGSWVRNSDGGVFSSPNYPNIYPPNEDCLYILEALPRQRIELLFDETFYIEASFECRFDHIEVRDGPFSFSPLINRFCGSTSPGPVLSSGRYMWIHFYSDEELEGTGFQVQYSFTPDPEFRLHAGELLNPIPDCQFQLSGADGLIHSSQVEEETRISPDQAVDCIWTIRAPTNNRIFLRFLEYQMENSNECKKNFVAVYDGSNAIEDLKAKFCSTVANDVMLDSGVGVVRMWADETSRLSRFRMLFTSFQEPPCEGNAFFCHSNMCINTSLVCNGLQNCVFPWDESNCKERKGNGIFSQITQTQQTIICASTGIVVLLLLISIVVQVKQPRKKVLVRKNLYNPADSQEVFDPPHYELFTLRDKELSGDPGELSEELQALRKSSVASCCVREHHCGSQASVNSTKSSRGVPAAAAAAADAAVPGVGSMEMTLLRGDDSASSPPVRGLNRSVQKKSWPNLKLGRMEGDPGMEDRGLCLHDRVMEEEEEEEEEKGRYDVYIRRPGSRRGHCEMAQQRSLSMDF